MKWTVTEAVNMNSYVTFIWHATSCNSIRLSQIIFFGRTVANLNCRRNRKDMFWLILWRVVQMNILFYAFYWNFSNKHKYREKRLNGLQKVHRDSSWRLISFNSMIKTLICLCLWKQNILIRNITHSNNVHCITLNIDFKDHTKVLVDSIYRGIMSLILTRIPVTEIGIKKSKEF